MGRKENDINIAGRFWSIATDGKIIDAEQIDGLDSVQNGDGDTSLQFKQNVSKIEYTGSSQYSFLINGSGALQYGTINFSQNSKVNRNNFLNVGVKNVVDFNDNSKLDADDGGIIAGYKIYSDSRGTSLFGAWNRAMKSTQSLIGGYRNIAIDGSHVIMCGQNNFLINQGNNATFGEHLTNKWRNALVVGRGNDYSIDVYNQLNKKNPLFIVGNEKTSPSYTWKEFILTESNSPEFPTIDDVIEYNKKYKENPTGEDLFYYTKTFNFNNLILSRSSDSHELEVWSGFRRVPYSITTAYNEGDVVTFYGRYFKATTDAPVGQWPISGGEVNSEYWEEIDPVYVVYRRVSNSRSNAFIVSEDGRALLNRKSDAIVGDNDLLTKGETDSFVILSDFSTNASERYRFIINSNDQINDDFRLLSLNAGGFSVSIVGRSFVIEGTTPDETFVSRSISFDEIFSQQNPKYPPISINNTTILCKKGYFGKITNDKCFIPKKGSELTISKNSSASVDIYYITDDSYGYAESVVQSIELSIEVPWFLRDRIKATKIVTVNYEPLYWTDPAESPGAGSYSGKCEFNDASMINVIEINNEEYTEISSYYLDGENYQRLPMGLLK